MAQISLTERRLANQHLSAGPFATAAEAVGWLGAVQSQDFAGGKWAVALRTTGLTEAALDAAFDAGEILRTHVLRPTWHFVTAADLRWMLRLSGARVIGLSGSRHRELGLDAKLLNRCGAALEKALAGGRQLTRTELHPVLARAGLAENTTERSAHVLGWAELQGLLVSGARRGKQHTFALLEERVPPAPPGQPGQRDEALAALARRYFASRGPATLADFVWWSGMTLTDARAALRLIEAELESETVGEATYWSVPGAAPAASKTITAYLLPNYDEYLVGYADRLAAFDPAHTPHLDARRNVLFEHTLVLNGRVRGTWKRTLSAKAVTLALRPFAPLTAAESKAAEGAVARFGAYVGLPVRAG